MFKIIWSLFIFNFFLFKKFLRFLVLLYKGLLEISPEST